MAGLVATALANALSIKSDPVGAMANANNSLSIASSTLMHVDGALARAEARKTSELNHRRDFIEKLTLAQVNNGARMDLQGERLQAQKDISNANNEGALKRSKVSAFVSMYRTKSTQDNPKTNASYTYDRKTELEKLKHTNRMGEIAKRNSHATTGSSKEQASSSKLLGLLNRLK